MRVPPQLVDPVIGFREKSILIKEVDVRFKNNGLDAIEVQDNGIGISRENYETVGKSSLVLCLLYAHLSE